MPVLQPTAYADIFKAGLAKFEKLKWTDIAQDIQEFVALPKMLRRSNVEFADGGHSFTFDVNTDNGATARMVGLYDTDVINVTDGLQQATVPWRNLTHNYAFDAREIPLNSGEARIVDLIKVKRTRCLKRIAEKFEDQFWASPATSSDITSLWGIKYWIVANASEGFNGGAPSGFSDVAGLSPTTYPNWKNWTAQYTSVTKADLVTKLRTAATKTMFMSPVPQPALGDSDNYGYYTNYDVLGEMEKLLEEQNDNLGNDIASKDGKVLFRGRPVTWVPKLDSDTADPFYGINWGKVKAMFLRGWYGKETGPDVVAGQHNVLAVYMDYTCNIACFNRRRQFVISK